MTAATTGLSRRPAPAALGALLLVLVAGLAPGRSSAQLFTDTESRKAIAAQRETIAAQQQQIADLIKQNEQLSGRVGQLENALKSQALLELLNQVEALQADLRKLRGQQEVLGNGIETATRRQRDMYIDLDSRLKRVEVPAAPAAPSGAPAPGSAAAPAAAAGSAPAPAVAAAAAGAAAAASAASAGSTAPAVVPGAAAPASTVTAGAAAAPAGPIVVPPGAAGPMQGARAAGPSAPATPATPATPAAAPAVASAGETAAEQRAYDAAHELRRIGNYAGAITAFQAFIRISPKSRLAPAAQYWVGDSHFNLREFRMAIAAQRQLITSWPDNEKVPDALLNIASSQSELGDTPAARKTMEDLVARYPVSDAAERAKRRLSARK